MSENEKTEIQNSFNELREEIYKINLFLERAIFKNRTYDGLPTGGKNLGRRDLSEAVRDGFDDCMHIFQRKEKEEKKERNAEIKKMLKIALFGAGVASCIIFVIGMVC